MNTDTGKITLYTEGQLEAARAAGLRLIEVNPSLLTPKQYENMAVSLHDTRSPLGKVLRRERSKYTPHVGKKQKAKQMTRPPFDAASIG